MSNDIISIREKLQSQKIVNMQLDPNGACNVGCWYCPVAYVGNPAHAKKDMPQDLLHKILLDFFTEQHKEDGLVGREFSGFYTAHYNEILLYKHFEFLLQECRSFRYRFMVLSNGTTLSKKKVDLLAEYPDVVSGLNLNIPIFSDAELWGKRVNSNPRMHKKVLENIQYAMDKLPDMVKNKSFSVVVNGIHHNSMYENGGWITTGKNFPTDIDLNVNNGEHAKEVAKAKSLFPELQIYGNPSLIDRAGLLTDVIDNKKAIEQHLMNNQHKEVTGCHNSFEVGGRPFGWVHVNANGECFLCCNDYDMTHVYGDFKTQSIRDFWVTDDHAELISKSFKTICRSCASAEF